MKKRICIVKFPSVYQWYPLYNFAKIIQGIEKDLLIITGNYPLGILSNLINIRTLPVQKTQCGKILRYFYIRFIIFLTVLSKKNDFDIIIIFQNYEAALEILFFSKILRKQTIICTGGSPSKSVLSSRIPFSRLFSTSLL